MIETTPPPYPETPAPLPPIPPPPVQRQMVQLPIPGRTTPPQAVIPIMPANYNVFP